MAPIQGDLVKIDDWLLEILACPQCHAPLRADVEASELVCTNAECGLAYPDVTPDPSIGQAHLVLQIQRGRHRTLEPAPYGVSQFIRPPWLSHTS